MSNELKEVGAYDEFRGKINEVKDYCDFLPDMTSDDGYQKSKRVALDVGKILTAVEHKRKELKADSIALGKSIDGEAKSIVAELSAFQIPHKSAYKELDTLKKEREQRRKDELDRRVCDMRMLPELMADADSSALADALKDVNENECLDFYEFSSEALKARNSSSKKLALMLEAKLKQEADEIELAELRAKQAEQDRIDHDNKVAEEAKLKAEQAAQAAIDQAAKEKRQAEENAKAAVLATETAEKKAKEDAAKAKKQAEADVIEAEERAKKLQIRVQKEAEEAEKAATEKREANTRNISKVRKAAKDSIMKLGFDEAQAKKLVLAIHNKDIENISITY